MQLKAMVLAGGIGSRLWPLSTDKEPKQFLKLFSGYSLFQITILRNKFMGRPVVLLNKENLLLAETQLKEIGIEADIIVEPTRKNTAPSAILAAIYAQKFGYDHFALIPCDHYISNDIAYQNIMNLASEIVDEDTLVTVGIKPTMFNSGYGYIEAVKKEGSIFQVSKFKEKPNSDQKEIFTNNNYYYWNSGIYIASSKNILTQSHNFCPYTAALVKKSFENSVVQENIIYPSSDYYNHAEAGSFDIVFSEKMQNIVMVEASFSWEDLGCWGTLFERIIHGYDLSQYQPHQPEDINQPAIIHLKNLIAICHNNHFLIAKKDQLDQVIHFTNYDISERQINKFRRHIKKVV